jgi:hypothetical protein
MACAGPICFAWPESQAPCPALQGGTYGSAVCFVMCCFVVSCERKQHHAQQGSAVLSQHTRLLRPLRLQLL